MKLLGFLSLLLLCISCNSSKKTQTGAEDLNGEWVPVQQELGGNKLPHAYYEHQLLTVQDNKYTLVAESVDKGEVKYSNGKMDIYGKEGVNAGKHFPAIYKYENGMLTVCYNLAGDSYPAAFETRPKTLLFLSVFKRK